MAIPADGRLKMTHIVAEFKPVNNSAPHSLSEYYRGGGNVPDRFNNRNIPVGPRGRAIKYSDFRGTSDATLPYNILIPTICVEDAWKFMRLRDGTFMTRWDQINDNNTVYFTRNEELGSVRIDTPQDWEYVKLTIPAMSFKMGTEEGFEQVGYEQHWSNKVDNQQVFETGDWKIRIPKGYRRLRILATGAGGSGSSQYIPGQPTEEDYVREGLVGTEDQGFDGEDTTITMPNNQKIKIFGGYGGKLSNATGETTTNPGETINTLQAETGTVTLASGFSETDYAEGKYSGSYILEINNSSYQFYWQSQLLATATDITKDVRDSSGWVYTSTSEIIDENSEGTLKWYKISRVKSLEVSAEVTNRIYNSMLERNASATENNRHVNTDTVVDVIRYIQARPGFVDIINANADFGPNTFGTPDGFRYLLAQASELSTNTTTNIPNYSGTDTGTANTNGNLYQHRVYAENGTTSNNNQTTTTTVSNVLPNVTIDFSAVNSGGGINWTVNWWKHDDKNLQNIQTGTIIRTKEGVVDSIGNVGEFNSGVITLTPTLGDYIFSDGGVDYYRGTLHPSHNLTYGDPFIGAGIYELWSAPTATSQVTSTTASTPLPANSAATDSEFVVSSNGNFYYEYNAYLQNTQQSVRPELEIYVDGVRQVNYTGSSAPTLTGGQGEIRLASGRLNITNPDSTVRVVTDLKTITTSASSPEIDGGGFSTIARSGTHDLPLGATGQPAGKGIFIWGQNFFASQKLYTDANGNVSVVHQSSSDTEKWFFMTTEEDAGQFYTPATYGTERIFVGVHNAGKPVYVWGKNYFRSYTFSVGNDGYFSFIHPSSSDREQWYYAIGKRGANFTTPAGSGTYTLELNADYAGMEVIVWSKNFWGINGVNTMGTSPAPRHLVFDSEGKVEVPHWSSSDPEQWYWCVTDGGTTSQPAGVGGISMNNFILETSLDTETIDKIYQKYVGRNSNVIDRNLFRQQNYTVFQGINYVVGTAEYAAQFGSTVTEPAVTIPGQGTIPTKNQLISVAGGVETNRTYALSTLPASSLKYTRDNLRSTPLSYYANLPSSGANIVSALVEKFPINTYWFEASGLGELHFFNNDGGDGGSSWHGFGTTVASEFPTNGSPSEPNPVYGSGGAAGQHGMRYYSSTSKSATIGGQAAASGFFGDFMVSPGDIVDIKVGRGGQSNQTSYLDLVPGSQTQEGTYESNSGDGGDGVVVVFGSKGNDYTKISKPGIALIDDRGTVVMYSVANVTCEGNQELTGSISSKEILLFGKGKQYYLVHTYQLQKNGSQKYRVYFCQNGEHYAKLEKSGTAPGPFVSPSPPAGYLPSINVSTDPVNAPDDYVVTGAKRSDIDNDIQSPDPWPIKKCTVTFNTTRSASYENTMTFTNIGSGGIGPSSIVFGPNASTQTITMSEDDVYVLRSTGLQSNRASSMTTRVKDDGRPHQTTTGTTSSSLGPREYPEYFHSGNCDENATGGTSVWAQGRDQDGNTKVFIKYGTEVIRGNQSGIFGTVQNEFGTGNWYGFGDSTGFNPQGAAWSFNIDDQRHQTIDYNGYRYYRNDGEEDALGVCTKSLNQGSMTYTLYKIFRRRLGSETITENNSNSWTTLEMDDGVDGDFTDLRVTPSLVGNFYVQGGLTYFNCFFLGDGTGTGTTWARPPAQTSPVQTSPVQTPEDNGSDNDTVFDGPIMVVTDGTGSPVTDGNGTPVTSGGGGSDDNHNEPTFMSHYEPSTGTVTYFDSPMTHNEIQGLRSDQPDGVFSTGTGAPGAMIGPTRDDNISDSGGSGTSSQSDKIVCTEMYRQTQLDDWKTAMKIWGLHTKTHLTRYHQRGYHFLFMPWVKGMRKSGTLTKSGGWLAQRRTQHLKYILSRDGYAGHLGIGKKEKDDIVGRIWCTVWHPVTFVTGKILSIFRDK